MGEWISVKKTLPNVNGQYLVVVRDPMDRAFISMVRFTTNLEKLDDQDFPGKKRPGWYGYDSEWGYFEHHNVTHWMPLPEMPEEKPV